MKKWYKSKTLWAGFAEAAAAVVIGVSTGEIVGGAQIALAVCGVVTLILRTVTGEKLTG